MLASKGDFGEIRAGFIDLKKAVGYARKVKKVES